MYSSLTFGTLPLAKSLGTLKKNRYLFINKSHTSLPRHLSGPPTVRVISGGADKLRRSIVNSLQSAVETRENAYFVTGLKELPETVANISQTDEQGNSLK